MDSGGFNRRLCVTYLKFMHCTASIKEPLNGYQGKIILMQCEDRIEGKQDKKLRKDKDQNVFLNVSEAKMRPLLHFCSNIILR